MSRVCYLLEDTSAEVRILVAHVVRVVGLLSKLNILLEIYEKIFFFSINSLVKVIVMPKEIRQNNAENSVRRNKHSTKHLSKISLIMMG